MPPAQKLKLRFQIVGADAGSSFHRELKKIYFRQPLIETARVRAHKNGELLIACGVAVLRLNPACPMEWIGSQQGPQKRPWACETFAIFSTAAGWPSAQSRGVAAISWHWAAFSGIY